MINPVSKICIIALAILVSCSQKQENKPLADDSEKRVELTDVEQAYAQQIDSFGLKAALLSHMDSNFTFIFPGLGIRQNAEAVESISSLEETNMTIKWMPARSVVQGDGGYAYGMYSVKPAGLDTLIFGTYVNIWEKNKEHWALKFSSLSALQNK